MNKIILCLLSSNSIVNMALPSHIESQKENHPLSIKQQEEVNRRLFAAIKSRDLKKVKAAFQAHAEVNARNASNNTPLIEAVRQGYGVYPIIKEIIAYKPDVNLKDTDGNTVLHIAAQDGDTKLITKLIVAGVHIDEKNNEGKTALMRAVEYKHEAIIKELIKQGADVDLQNGSNKTVYHYAESDLKVLQAIQDGLRAHQQHETGVKQQVSEHLLKDITNMVSAYTL